MYQINYFLISILAYLGLIIGMILVKISPEEQKPGKKYFLILQKIFFSLSLLFYLYYIKTHIILILIVLLLIIYIQKLFEKPWIIYSILGGIFYLSFDNQNLFLIETILILLYGISVGAYYVDYKTKNYIKLFFSNSIFLLISLILPFLISNL